MVGATDEQIWDALPEKMASYRRKGQYCKSSRWFSFNEVAETMLHEWSCGRMLLEWYFQAEVQQSPDNHSGLNFRDAGGLKLAYLGHGWHNWELCHIIVRIQKPLHEWYSDELHFVKTPEDGLRRLLAILPEWKHHWTLRRIIKSLNSGFQDIMEWVGNKPQFVAEAAGYGLGVLAQRVTTLATKCCSPPECYGEILRDDHVLQDRAISLMKRDWKRLQVLERSEAPGSHDLLQDLKLSVDSCCKLCFLCFEENNFRPTSRALDLLSFLCLNFADTKCVEDIHQSLRNDSNTKGNSRLGPYEVMECIMHSNSLEERNIDHSCAINYDAFVRMWHRTHENVSGFDMRASSQKLPEIFSRILGTKVWATMSEKELGCSSAAWQLFRHYCDNNLSNQNVKLQDFFIDSNLDSISMSLGMYCVAVDQFNGV